MKRKKATEKEDGRMETSPKIPANKTEKEKRRAKADRQTSDAVLTKPLQGKTYAEVLAEL